MIIDPRWPPPQVINITFFLNPSLTCQCDYVQFLKWFLLMTYEEKCMAKKLYLTNTNQFTSCLLLCHNYYILSSNFNHQGKTKLTLFFQYSIQIKVTPKYLHPNSRDAITSKNAWVAGAIFSLKILFLDWLSAAIETNFDSMNWIQHCS